MPYVRSVWLYVAVLLCFSALLSAQTEYKYSYMPKKVYVNQLFPVTVVGTGNSPTLTFDTSSPTQPLFMKPLEVKNGDETFYTFYFKAGKVDVRIPRLFISSNGGEVSLDEHRITLATLKPAKHFSGVLAADLKLKGQQVSNYDEKSHIVTLTTEAYEANIEDMALKNITEFGVEHIKRDNAKVTAEFYAVLPRTQKELEFCYFNTIKKRYISFQIPVKVADSSVTTQSDLNPKVDAFERLKRYTLIAFSIFFLLMFVWRRDFFYLILGVISIITLLTFYIPHKKICVKQGAPLYILPTETSTIHTRVETKLDTMLLGERGEFKKIEYKKGIIGWIKNEDICNN
ncbi:MAG TPA: hypothetical protein ENK98_04855 [Epsilonproteobacteria bacterium]|nr:hypothetical protein [Campylobacterota bacterium]HHD78949.1 hypothetical protein [Campylobacterota bacterium]